MKILRELFSYMRPKGKRGMVWAVLSETGGALLSAGIMLLVFQMLAAVLGKTDTSMGYWIVLFCIALAGKFVCAMVSMLTTHVASFEMEVSLKESVIRRLKEFSLGFYTNEQLGAISTVVHDDIENLQKSVSHFGSKMVADCITAIVIGVCLFCLDWRIGLVMVSLIPVAIITQVRGFSKALSLKRANTKNLAAMVSRFVEFTKNIPLLKVFAGGMTFQDRVRESAARFEESSKAESRQGAKDNAQYFIPFELCYALVALIGGILTWQGSVDLDVFVYFIVFSRMFYLPFANVESYRMTWTQIKNSYGRVASLLNAPVIERPTQPKRAQGYDICFEHVGFRYAEDGFALEDVSFNLPQGSLTALVGPSGSGKTTITNLLLRFWDAQQGEIKVGGVDICDLDYDELLEKTSIVMQNVILFADTIYENIRVGNPNATQKQVEEAAKAAQIHDFILSLPDKYDTMLGENGTRLSGGEKQRISIARAFLKDAPILLLDEVTSNVDSLNEVLIQRAITRLATGRTVLMIAHHLQTVKSADNILVFKEGRLVESGDHEELLASGGVYHALWQAQMSAKEWTIA
jgi:ATP-binding cassette subfamily B protein